METSGSSPSEWPSPEENRSHLVSLLGSIAAQWRGLPADADVGDQVQGDDVRTLGGLTDDALVRWLQDVEQLSRLVDGLKVQGAGEAATRVRAGRYDDSGASGPADFLRRTLQIGAADAGRRLAVAAQTQPVVDAITGQSKPPLEPRLAAALRSGKLSADAARVVTMHVQQAAALCDGEQVTPAQVAEVEEELVRIGVETDPDFLARCATRMLQYLDQDGDQPTEAQLMAKEGIHFGRPRRGLVSFHGHLTVLDYEHLVTAIGTATNPRVQDAGPHEEQQEAVRQPDYGPSEWLQDAADAGRGWDVRPAVDDADLRDEDGDEDDDGDAARGGGGCGPADRSGGPAGADTVPIGDDSVPRGDDSVPRGDDSVPRGDDSVPMGVEEGPVGEVTRPTGADNVLAGDDRQSGCRDDHAALFSGGANSSRHDSADADTADIANVSTGSGTIGGTGTGTGVGTVADIVTRDRRTRAQQLLHGLIDCAKKATQAGLLPENGGLVPQLLVTVTLRELQQGLGSALLPMSGPVPVRAIRGTACDAGIVPVLLGGKGQVLDVGRTQRTVPRRLRLALHARDKGCVFPGCTRPGPWTEAHHIRHWADGGRTSVDNCCLLCSYHHHLIHRTDWTVEMRDGVPWFTPPVRLDHQQHRRRNSYHDPRPGPCPDSSRC